MSDAAEASDLRTVAASGVNPRLPALTVLALLLVLAGVSVFLGTSQGIGISPDSAVYIGAARSLLDGRGLTVPFGDSNGSLLTRFPPLYPVLLAGAGALADDPALAAAWVGAGLYLATAGLLAWMIARPAGRGPAAGVLAALLFLVSPAMLPLHLMAWSEPLFLALSAASLGLLILALERFSWRAVFAAGLAAGLACLTRYIGVALVACGGLCLAAWGQSGRRRRAAAAFGATALTPLLVWLAWTSSAAGSIAGRQISFHPIGVSDLWQAVDTVGRWLLLPDTVQGPVRAGLVLAAGVVVLAATAQAGRAGVEGSGASSSAAGRVLTSFVLVYLIALVGSISTIDANTPLDGRILSPIYLAGVGLIAWAAPPAWRWLAGRRPAAVTAAAGSLIFLAISLAGCFTLVSEARQAGLGFNRVDWRRSATMAAVDLLPEASLIASNAPEAIYIRTGRSADQLPRRSQSVNQRVNPEFEEELRALGERLAAQGGVVVLFWQVSSASLPTPVEIEQLMGLEAVAQTADGVIYGWPG